MKAATWSPHRNLERPNICSPSSAFRNWGRCGSSLNLPSKPRPSATHLPFTLLGASGGQTPVKQGSRAELRGLCRHACAKDGHLCQLFPWLLLLEPVSLPLWRMRRQKSSWRCLKWLSLCFGVGGSLKPREGCGGLHTSGLWRKAKRTLYLGCTSKSWTMGCICSFGASCLGWEGAGRIDMHGWPA